MKTFTKPVNKAREAWLKETGLDKKVEKAKEIGVQQFYKFRKTGTKKVPSQLPELMELLEGLEVNQRFYILKSYYKAYIAEQVKEGE